MKSVQNSKALSPAEVFSSKLTTPAHKEESLIPACLSKIPKLKFDKNIIMLYNGIKC